MNKGYWCIDITKMVPQNRTSILKIVVKQWHRHYSCKIALRMMPIGKLFHYISNMIYLSLVRFKIDFVYSNFSSNSTLSGRIKISFVLPINFPQGGEFFRSKFRAIARSFGFMLMPLFLLVVRWLLRKYHFDFNRRGVFVVVVVHSIWSLFHIN